MLLAASVGVLYFHNRMDEEIRRAVEERIAEQYPNLAVSVRGAQWVKGEGIEVRGLSIVEPGASGPAAQLAYLEELFLFSDVQWQDLIRGELVISHFAIRRPLVRMTRRPDGTWSAAKLLPLPKLSKDAPQGTIEGAVFEISDPSREPAATLTLREIDLEFGPAANQQPGPDGRRPLRVKGAMLGDHLKRIDLDAIFHPSGASFDAAGKVEALDFSQELIKSLPAEAASCLAELSTLRGQVQASFRVRRDPAAAPALTYEVQGELFRGRIDDKRLPYPLTDIRGSFRCDQLGFSARELTARSGPTTFRLDLAHTGYGKQGGLKLKAESRQMPLDERLLAVLPLSWQNQWNRFRPAGWINVELLELDFDGQNWRPHLVVKCLDVGFTYHQFPYRLEHAKGELTFQDNRLTIDLKAYSQGKDYRQGDEVRLKATLVNPGPAALVDLEVWTDRIQLDDKLFDALGDGPRRFVRSLAPEGTARVHFRCFSAETAPGVLHKDLSMVLNHCKLRYANFPYPLENIRGNITMLDGVWNFRELEGTNDTGRITCSGHLAPVGKAFQYSFAFHGENVPLDQELRQALSPGAARLWPDLKPRGAIQLDAIVSYEPGDLKPRVWVQARPLEGPSYPSASIEPSYFPYRLEKLQGKFTYCDGRVELENFRAEHGATRLAAHGNCQLSSDGTWRLKLNPMSVDRLRADRDLVQALSGRLKKAVMDLRPTGGPINLHGTLELASGGSPDSPITAAWDLELHLQQCHLDCGVELAHLNGRIHLAGAFDGLQYHAYGGLKIDSVIYKGFQFTEVMGPIWLDDKQVLLGLWADRQRGVKPQHHVTARLYEGRLVGDLWVETGLSPRYALQATLTEADLGRWAR
ncbi:MAG: hypothetical protein WD403_12255, partial [Pirellulales bacterium]